jgi:hypothetical protein
MAVTISNVAPNTNGAKREANFDITFDSSYPTGGESIDKTLLGFVSSIESLDIPSTDGFRFELDETNQKLKVHDKPYVETTVTVTDLDAAASTGVAVYVHVDEVSEQGSDNAHLEFVSPTNADGTGTAYNGGPTYYIQDDDNAASGGLALYFDEDATLGSRFLANTGRNCYVDIGGGRVIKVTADASPSSAGVQVYFDEDAATSYGRLLFVSPTNASGSDTTITEVDNATDLSSLTVNATAVGV